jgi:glyoxylate/hydroxypyruvate reductase
VSIALFSRNPHSATLQRFHGELARHLGEPVAIWPDLDPETVRIAIVNDAPDGALKACPKLDLIACAWAGVDRLYADPSVPIGPVVTRLIDPSLTQAMTETILAHVLAAHADWPFYAAEQAHGRWTKRKRPFAADVNVLICGFGVLAKPTAVHLRAIGFQVRGWARDARLEDGFEVSAGRAGLLAELARADIVVAVLPNTAASHHLFDADAFAAMKAGAAFINVGRGQVVDDAALLASLAADKPRRAILDVFHVEPLPPEHGFWQHPKVSIFPHVAAPTAADSPAQSIADVIRRFRAGEPLPEAVDRGRGY